MKQEPATPEPKVTMPTPDQGLERMKELARRLIQVPKAELLKPKPVRKRRTK